MDVLSKDLPDAERYKLLVGAVTDYAIYMLDPTGRIASWNAGAERFKGYSEDEIIGRNFSTFYTPEDQAAGMPRLALETAAGAGKFQSEGWRVRKDGSRFWAHDVTDSIRDGSGRLIGFAKVTRDLTERRQAEQILAESQQEFRLLVQSVTDYAIYMLDLEGNIVSWNPGAQRIKGYRPDEIIGQHFSRFYTEEDREAGLPAMALSTAAREGRFEKEGWRVRKDGTRFWANVVIDPIRGSSGNVRGFAKITRDVTERRESEHRLEETRGALSQSQKMEAVGKLTGGVAHDFNNLLSAIIGSLELAQKRLGSDPRVDDLLANAMQAAQRGASLTQRMLAFARRQELKPESVDVRTLVSAMTDMLARSLGPNFDIVTRFPPTLARILVDPNQFEMSILNLTINARDAMPDGGAITISAREEMSPHGVPLGSHPGRYVVLSIEDQGVGMDEVTLERATEPFFTTKGLGKGTGLGLSMIAGLAEQSGGRLELRSTLGSGTTASIWLPALGKSGKAPPLAEQPDIPASARESLKILAVDDDALVLLNTAAMLEDMGHVVTTASSGPRALRALEGMEQCDLIITDHGMPGMSGAQLIEEARTMRPGLPAILATGYAELPDGTAHGVLRLAKPFFQHQLAEVVRAVAD
jgi:PAS domain S-box-containing protein